MKKKFLLIVSLILAFVLSLTLMACGGGSGTVKPNPGPGPGPEPEPGPGDDKPTQPFTMQKAADAINGLAAADAVKGVAKVRLGEGASAASLTLPFDKRGDKAKITFPSMNGMEILSGAELLVDLDNGNAYMPIAPSSSQYFYIMQLLPQGYAEYAAEASGLYDLDFEVSADALEQIFAYDKTSNSMTATLDLAATVNAFILPMQTVYADGGSVEDLIDAYLALIPSEEELTLSDVLDSAEAIIAALERDNVTFDDAVTTIDAILEEEGVEASLRAVIAASEFAPEFENIKDRKITEAIRGALDLFEEYAASAVDAQEPQETVGMESVFDKLYEYMFVKDVDTSDLAEDIASYKNLILSLARTTGFDELVDGIDESDELAASFKTIVTKSVEFNELKAEITVGFDKNYNIKSVAVDTDVAYTADGGATLPALSSDDISIGLELDVKSYSATATPFAFGYMEGVTPELLPKSAAAVICGASEDTEYSVFYESCGVTVAADNISVYCIDESDETPVKVSIDVTDGVTFNAATSSFVFDQAVIDAAQAALGTDVVTVYVDATVSYLLTPVDVTVTLTYCPEYSTDALAEIPLPILNVINAIMPNA